MIWRAATNNYFHYRLICPLSSQFIIWSIKNKETVVTINRLSNSCLIVTALVICCLFLSVSVLMVLICVLHCAGCAAVRSPRYREDPAGQSRGPPHWLYLHQGVRLWAGPEVHWRRWALLSLLNTVIKFISTLDSFYQMQSGCITLTPPSCARCPHGARAVRHG